MVLGLALAASAVMAAEVDVSGSWAMTILGKSPLGEKEATLTFERQGFNLVVTIQTKTGATRSIGYIDGNNLRFEYITAGKKADVVSKFSGHVRGDLMGGELDMGKQGVTTWKATRGAEEEVDFSGTWTLQMRGESPSGLNLVKMTFRQDDHRLVVTLHGEKSEIECEGYVDGRIITFYYVRHTEGEEFVAKFTGQIAGALMGGEVDMGEMGKTTWRATQDI
jgi:hypothetical protein